MKNIFWLNKSDHYFSEFTKNKSLRRVLSAQLENGQTYYCFVEKGILIDQNQKKSLIAPLCFLNDGEIAIVVVKDILDYVFFLDGHRCINLSNESVEKISEENMTLELKFQVVDDVESLLVKEKIEIREYGISNRVLIILSVLLLTLLCLGLYLWLYLDGLF